MEGDVGCAGDGQSQPRQKGVAQALQQGGLPPSDGDGLEVIGQRLAGSLGLLVCAWILSGALGLALGVAAGASRD